MQPIERLSAVSKFERPQERKRSTITILAAAFLVLTGNWLCVCAQSAKSPTAVDPAEIVWKMVAQNETRARQLKYFTACRHYHIEFHGLGRTMTADMHVQVTYTAGYGKRFHVIDESGSHLLLDHVLTRLLQTEQDDSRLQKAALTPFNYNFTFDTLTNENGRLLYVFSVEPKVKNKLLYRGKIWIDAGDYAVVRVEAQPAENPSFWIKSAEIHHSYEKTGEFWLPHSNVSESKTRFGGTAVLKIDYGIYQFEAPHNAALAATPELAASAP